MWINVLFWMVAGVQATVILVWIWQHVEMGRIASEGLRVPNRSPSGELPPLMVLVPARNEAARIGDCVRSLLEQNYPGLQAIVVDDRSEDGTGDCVIGAAQGDSRLRVIRIDELPGGWSGKSHALWRGAQEATTPWLLFVDADCRIDRGGLAAAVNYAVEYRSDLLSLWPRDGSEGFWERLLVPLCGAMIVIWYGRSASHHRDSPVAFANGQFLLIRRDAYLSIGGHSAVKDAIVEDIPLARLAKAKGLSVRSAIGTDVFTVRMYATLHEVVAGWRRIYLGVLTPGQIALCATSIIVGSLPPYIVLPILLSFRHSIDSAWSPWFIALSAAHLAALMATSIRFFSIARCRLRYLWLYPISCFGVLCILGGSLRRSLGRTAINWRGTTYHIRRSAIRD